VGYGDVLACSAYEKGLCSLLMLIGAVIYSFALGQFISLITTYDDAKV
jgi:hypothetical protein